MATRPLIIAARFKYLLAVPFLLIVPLAFAYSALNRSDVYSSSANVWVDQPLYSAPQTGPGYNPWMSIAANHAATLQERLSTNEFAARVGERAGLKATTPGERGYAAYVVRRGISVYANGQHLVVIRHKSGDPELSQKIVTAVADEYHAQFNEIADNDASLALKIYNAQLQTQQDDINSANRDLAAYLQANPTSQNDARSTVLRQAVLDAQSNYKQTQGLIASINLDSEKRKNGDESAYQVVDPATVPTSPIPATKRDQLALPIAGLLLATSVSACIYAFLLRTDNSIRVAEDLRLLPGLALLGTVPDVSSVRRRNWPKHFFRLAVTALGVSVPR